MADNVMGNVMTLHDLATRHGGADRKVLSIVEMMSTTRPLLNDMSWQEGNLPTGHIFSVRGGLPGVHWRKINQGVPTSKSTVFQVTETCGMLETVSNLDEKLVRLSSDPAAFRLSESLAFLEAMGQEFSTTLWYGNGQMKPETITGFSPRFNNLTGPVKRQIIDAGGTGPNLASIWLVVWSPLTTFGIYPKGSKVGLQHHASGVIELADENGDSFRGYRDRYQWDTGLCLRDPRYVVRIANIDVDKLPTFGTASNQAADLISLMNIATNRIHNINLGKVSWYMNRDVKEGWENQMLKTSYIQHIREGGASFEKWSEAFKMVKISVDDGLISTEERVV